MRYWTREGVEVEPFTAVDRLDGCVTLNHPDGLVVAWLNIDTGDEDDSWRAINHLAESHIVTQPEPDGPVYRAESEPDPACNGEIRTVRREQLWPYVPPEVDMEAEIARLRVFEKRPLLVGSHATVTVSIDGRDVAFRDVLGIDLASDTGDVTTAAVVARPDGFYDIAWVRQEFRSDELADALKLTRGVYGGGGFTWNDNTTVAPTDVATTPGGLWVASNPIVITAGAHAESQLPDCLLPAPDHLAMCAKRPGWYAMTGHEYRLWGPPTARHLRTLSPKTIKRRIRRAERQGRHIHACDVAMENIRRPRAESAARRAAASAQARWRRKQWKRMSWVDAAQRLGTVAAQAFNRVAKSGINEKR